MATFAHIMLWHQGEKVRRLQEVQVALQTYNMYQLHDVRNKLRDDNN